MKKFLTLLVLCSLLLNILVVSAGAEDNSAITSPRYNNTVTTETTFMIFPDGTAEVTVYFDGYQGVATGATIKTKIQKKFLLFFWQDVDIGLANNTWVDNVTGDSAFISHTVKVSSGTYKSVVEYTIYGTGGDPDVHTSEIEYTY